MICVGCEQPIRDVSTSEAEQFEHVPEIDGQQFDHEADPGSLVLPGSLYDWGPDVWREDMYGP